MDKWVLVVGTNCADPKREKEFDDWYNNTHLPDVLETRGFTGATRYVDPEAKEGEAKFWAFYEIETNDIQGFLKKNDENLAKKRAAGRFSELLVLVSRGLYRQTYSVSK
jgi:hypothetical protein